jgi:divalent metal cation (Fe/Co/Zn/Cd) transporter
MVYTIIGIISLGAMIAGFALSQLLILICAGIGWVAFGFLIYNTAPSNLGAALLILGIAFALVCFVWPLALAVRRRRGRPSYEDQDYKNYEEQVRNITRR